MPHKSLSKKMRLPSSAIERPSGRLLVLIAMVVMLTASCTASQHSAGAADVARITAPGGSGEGWDFDHNNYLVVKVKPNSTTEGNTEYTVDLYEKGKFRDTSSVSWSASDLNMQNPEYVYFQLTDEEFQAYSQITRTATKDEYSKSGILYVYKDLQEIFSVTVTKAVPGIFATLGSIYVEPDPEYPAPYDFYRIVVEILPTFRAMGMQHYKATLCYVGDNGDKYCESTTVVWTQAQIDSHTAFKFYAFRSFLTRANKDQAEEAAQQVIQRSPELELVRI